MHYAHGFCGSAFRQGMEGTASPQLDIFKPGGASHLKAHSLTLWLVLAVGCKASVSLMGFLSVGLHGLPPNTEAVSEDGGPKREGTWTLYQLAQLCFQRHSSHFCYFLLFPKWAIQAKGEWGGV